MARAPQPKTDPAGEAAALLRRIGFVGLMVGLPVAAFAARTGPVLVVAIAIPLIVAASLIDGARRPARTSIEALLGSPALLAVAVAAGWAVASAAWAPPSTISTRGSGLIGTLGVVGLGFSAYFALPDRMRSANLYPMTVGAAVSACLGLSLWVGWTGEGAAETARRSERGFAILVVVTWPALAWLRSRGRDMEAFGLAVLVAATAAFAPTPVPVVAFAIGALAYLVVGASERTGAVAVGAMLALVILSGPLLVVGLARIAPALGWDWLRALADWQEALLRSPARLLTGHGSGSLRADPAAAGLQQVFGAPLLGAWYELGIVGATAAAAAVFFVLRGAAASFGPLRPGLAGGTVTGFGLALSGIDGGALWWPAALAATVLLFLATERGQFRTRRPRAAAIGPASATQP